jgi:ATP-dependent Zn protease
MFNFIHNILAKIYFTSPSVHYVQPKSLNLHFKSSLENKYVWLNLQHYNWVHPVVEQVKEAENNYFILKIEVEHKNGDKLKIDLSKFETRKEADNALNVFTNKLFSPEKSILKFSVVAMILVFIWGLTIEMFMTSNRNIASSRASSNQAMVQTVPNQAISPEDQAKIVAELQRQAGAVPSPAPSPSPTVMTPQENPAVQNLLNGLGGK